MTRGKESVTALAALMTQLEQDVAVQIEETIEARTANVLTMIADAQEQLNEALRTNTASLNVKVGINVNKIDGTRHKQLDQMIKIAANRLAILVVGMSGTGKTHAAEQVAEALGLEFYAMSVGAQTSKSDILGYMHAGGDYVRSLFREAYEHGGVFLMDELDAGNANVLIQVNAALSNSYCAFPDGMVKRNDDFVFIASANTFGNGANRQYVGRNQLDASTLDRFVILEWEIDEKLEKLLVGSDKQAMKWYGAVLALRKKVAADGMRVLVTPRASLRGATLLAAGVPMQEAAELSLIKSFPSDKQKWARDIAKVAWAP